MEAGLPNINGEGHITTAYSTSNYFRGAFIFHQDQYGTIGASGPNSVRGNLEFSANNSNSIYGSSETVTPLSLSAIFVIKY